MNDKHDFTKGKILPKMISFMLPILGALILQALYSTVDLFIVGRFADKSDISGVSTGGSVIMLFTMVASSLSTGVTVLIGNYIGQKREDRIGGVIGGAAILFLILSALISASLLVFAPQLAILMQAPIEAFQATVSYIRICGGGMVFIVFYNMISCVFRGIGDSKSPLIFVAAACIVNIIGDLLLVAGFKMGTAGAAYATVIAQALSVVLSVLLIRKRLPYKLIRKDFRLNREVTLFVKIGFPMVLQSVLTDLSFSALCAFINRLGLEQSSGYGIGNRIVSFVLLIPSALMQSMSSFVSQNVGANNEKRAKASLYRGMEIGLCFGIVTCVLTFFGGKYIAGIFSDDALVIENAALYLKGFSLEAVVTAFLFSYIGYFSGHRKTVFVMIQGLLQTFLVRLPVSYFMSIQENASLFKIGLAAPAATAFGIILNTVYFVLYNRNSRNITMKKVDI